MAPRSRPSSQRRQPAAEASAQPDRGRSARRNTAEPARPSSQRRQAADPAPARAATRGSATRGSAKESKRQSARAAAPGGKAGKGRPSDRQKSSRSSAEENSASRRGAGERSGRATARKSGKGKRILTWVLIALVLIAAGLAMATPGYLRARSANALAIAEAAELDAAAHDYLERVDYSPLAIDRFVNQRSDAPVTTRLRLMELAYEESDGRVARFQTLINLAAGAQVSQQDRSQALRLAARIYDRSQHGNAHVPQDILRWAVPEERPDQERRELAMAAISLLTHLYHRTELRVDVTLAELAGSPTADSRLIEEAMRALAAITSPRNVGYAMNLLIGPNADAASRVDELTLAVYQNVQAAHIPNILRLWESPIDEVASLGYRAIGGPRVSLGDDDAATREDLGRRISGMLTADLLRTARPRFDGLLDATQGLRLTGTREQLLRLVPDMDEELQDKTAAVLASFVRAGDEQQQDVNEDVVRRLTQALQDDQRHRVASLALSRIRATPSPGQIRAFRAAIEAAAERGDAASMEALHHIVSAHYRRGDVIETLGDDPARWRSFLEEDRPRYSFYDEAVTWYEENRQKIRVSDRDTIPANRERVTKTREELGRWLEDERVPVPLGLTRQQVERFNHDLNVFSRALIGAHGHSRSE